MDHLQEGLETSYRDVREKLKVAQRHQKDSYDRGIKHTTYKPGDLVLRYTPQLKDRESSKFHKQREGPYEVIKRTSEVTYRLRKVGGHCRRSDVVHFNNLKLYQKKLDKLATKTVKEKTDTAVLYNLTEEQSASVEKQPDHDP